MLTPPRLPRITWSDGVGRAVFKPARDLSWATITPQVTEHPGRLRMRSTTSPSTDHLHQVGTSNASGMFYASG